MTTTGSAPRLPRSERETVMLDAAGEAFAREGYHGASMNEIAAAAGITKPMLYNYFGSKEGLYLASLRRTGTELTEALLEATSGGQPMREQLSSGIVAFLGFVEAHSASWTVLHAETVSGTGPASAGAAALRARMIDLIALELPGPADVDPQMRAAYAHALVGAGESLANWWLEHPEQPRDRIAELFLRLADVF